MSLFPLSQVNTYIIYIYIYIYSQVNIIYNIILCNTTAHYIHINAPAGTVSPGPSKALPHSFNNYLCAQLCPTLCDPMDCSPPDSSVHGISQARILEWVTISSSKGSSDPGIKPASLHFYIIIRLGAKGTTERKTDIVPDLVAPVI